MSNPWQFAQRQLSEIAQYISLEPNILEKLRNPDRVLKVFLPVKMDNGSLEVFCGFRSQHSNALGPYKGGIRFHPRVSEEEVKALSMWMTWKCSLAGIPFGGGKGGVVVNPKELSSSELERLSKAYIKAITPIIGENKDIPAPDIGTDSQVMAWMFDEYVKVTGQNTPGILTGKPLEVWGSQGRTEATGRGGLLVLGELARKLHISPENTTIAVQGIGNVGFWFAKLAFDEGYKIISLSDSKGAIFSKNLDPQKVMKYKEKTGSVVGFPNTKTITNEELLELNVDILAPAALENVVTKENVSKIKARYILELANGPVTFEASKILHKNKIISVPDILANLGGVIVSYLEWVQNKAGYFWKEEKVNQKLKEIITGAFQKVWRIHKEKNVDLRTAAYILAILKVAQAIKIKHSYE